MLIQDWIYQTDDAQQRDFRKAVHIALRAISYTQSIPFIALKGSILISLSYFGSRKTKDVDFSTNLKKNDFDIDELTEELSENIILSNEELEYDVVCQLQNFKFKPPSADSSWPTIKFSIGYASYGKASELKKLRNNNSPRVLHLDCSINEEITEYTYINIDEDITLKAYSLHDLIAEKYRAIIQQKTRHPSGYFYRKQDIYDIYKLLTENSIYIDKSKVLHSLIQKSHAREIDIYYGLLEEKIIVERSRKGYEEQAQEVADNLPPFDTAYKAINDFFNSLFSHSN